MARGAPTQVGDLRFTAVVTRAPTRSNESRPLRVAGTIAIVATLALATLVFLTDSSASAALAATAGKASGATANSAPTAAAAAPAKGSIAAAGKGTQKMSDEELQEPPSYADLQREVKELEHEEKDHFNNRAKSLSRAMASADADMKADPPLANAKAIKNLKWKSAKDKYEQAAYKDIMDEEKERIQDSITEEGAEMFQQYEKKAQSLMGTDELNKLNNETAEAEQERSRKEKTALTALKSASHSLKKVDLEENAERQMRDEKKQQRANARIAAHLRKSVAAEQGSQQYYAGLETSKAHVAEVAAKQKQLVKDYNSDRQALKARDAAKLGAKHDDTPYHRDYIQAESIEDQRNAAFAKEIQQLKSRTEEQRKIRAKMLASEEKETETEVSEKEKSVFAKAKALALSKNEKKQVKSVLKKLGKKTSARADNAQAKADEGAEHKDDVSMSANYEATVQAAMEADLKRRQSERKARMAFEAQRDKRLIRDMSAASQDEKDLAAVSDKILQPDQLVNAERMKEDGSDLGGAQRIIKGRDQEVNMIVGN